MSASRAFHLITFGCQMNEYDTEIMRSVLKDRGLREVSDAEQADLVLVNTCAVREGAEDRAVGRLQSLKSIKRERPDFLIGMTGCVAQEHGEKTLDRLPFLDMVVGTRDLLKVGLIAEEVWRTGERIVAVEDIDSPLPLPIRAVSTRARPLKATITIMLGCDKECTYCIVPKTRGAEWSRPFEEVMAEARQLVAHGYKEIMLLGQNVNSYRGLRADGSVCTFAGLLRAMDAMGAEMSERGEGDLLRLRYTTSHPIDASDELWDAMRDCPRVCDQLHLPVQSGSDRVLRRMKRLYKRAHYLERVAALTSRIPHLTMTTDFIVGFCGETDEDFEETLSLVREVRFDQAYTFMYSPRPGTPSAEHLTDDVPIEVKKERLARLIALQEAIALEKNEARIGNVVRVLVEGPSKRPEGWVSGRTEGDIVVNFPCEESMAGTIVEVEITEAGAHTLRGQRATNLARS